MGIFNSALNGAIFALFLLVCEPLHAGAPSIIFLDCNVQREYTKPEKKTVGDVDHFMINLAQRKVYVFSNVTKAYEDKCQKSLNATAACDVNSGRFMFERHYKNFYVKNDGSDGFTKTDEYFTIDRGTGEVAGFSEANFDGKIFSFIAGGKCKVGRDQRNFSKKF